MEEGEGKNSDWAVCNRYLNEKSACKFYTDLERDYFWERLTCVVSQPPVLLTGKEILLSTSSSRDKYEPKQACSSSSSNSQQL